MKKVVLIIGLLAIVAMMGCDRDQAFDRILADSGSRAYIMNKLFEDGAMRDLMADSTFANAEIMDAFFTELSNDDFGRERMLNYILAVDTTAEWLTGKLAENADYKKAMKNASRR